MVSYLNLIVNQDESYLTERYWALVNLLHRDAVEDATRPRAIC